MAKMYKYACGCCCEPLEFTMTFTIVMGSGYERIRKVVVSRVGRL